MITDKDIKKMKEVFATKDDIKQVNKRLGGIETKLDNMSTNIKSLAGDVVTVIEMVGDTNQKIAVHENDINDLKLKIFSQT